MTVVDSAGQAYLSGLGIGPILVDDIESAYEVLDNGGADAVVFDAPVLRFHATREGQGEVVTVGPDFESVQYGVVLSEDRGDLRVSFNLLLLDLIESGAYERLHDKWFGASTD